jgi:cellulose synthase/poly-beta-1,6-N-acetylglucosamine synthase-like glycosyltransferase
VLRNRSHFLPFGCCKLINSYTHGVIVQVVEIIFWASVIITIYVYAGYPVLMSLLAKIIRRPVQTAEIEPSVTMILSAYNEEKEIAQKIENSLALDYPAGKFEMIVVSDSSTDATDEIIQRYADRGVKYLRQEPQQGKTSALNWAVPQASGELIFFTDANAMMEPDALRKLVRNFADEKVGYVCGHARYRNRDESLVGDNESTYWDYETKLRADENTTGNIVGSDGAIYMLRKELFTPLQKSDINDFVNPLQVIAKGYRGVFEAEAVCYENVGVTHDEEFRRKVRIVNRSLNGFFRVKSVMNPFKTGSFAFKIISHKLLRWFVPVFMLSAFIANLALWGSTWYYSSLLIGQLVFYLTAFIGYEITQSEKVTSGGLLAKILHITFFFSMVNLASLLGIWRYLKGDVQVTWQPERANVKATETSNDGN